jgi:List-Bact-rpt repeat protein
MTTDRRTVAGLPGGTGRLAALYPSLLAVAVVLALLLSGTAASAAPAGSAAPPLSHSLTAPVRTNAAPAPTPSAASHGSTLAQSSARAAPLGPSPTKRGVFFLPGAIPNPDPANQTSYYGTLENVSNEPSVNYTSTGLLATAYTAYTVHVACPGQAAYAKSEIGFVASTDQGANWSAPVYLGNPVCSGGTNGNYSSAYQPTLTSLANGTLVLAYIEFNVSAYFYAMPYLYYGPYSYSSSYNRLVVTESYDNGTNWTTPQVINASANLLGNAHSFAPVRPWITAVGQTIYLTWTNMTAAYSTTYSNGTYGTSGSAAVHLIVSKNGGSSWGSPVTLKTYVGQFAQLAEFSTLAIGAGGELLVAYASNFSLIQYACVGAYCFYDVGTADVILATSTDNGTTFAYSIAAQNVWVWTDRWGDVAPAPQVAVSPATGEVAVAFTATTITQYCYVFGCYQEEVPNVWITNSSTNGATWSTVRIAEPSLNGLNQGYQVYNPAIAYDGAGTLHLAVSYLNDSACYVNAYGSTLCGELSEQYASSATNGRSFAPSILVSDNETPYASNPDGEYATLATSGNQVFVGWTMVTCSVYTYSSCYWVGSTGVAEVHVSSLFEGTGLSITFNESGITNGTLWEAEVMGNVVSGYAPTELTLTGIPAGDNITWNVTNISGGYGIRYSGVLSLQGPWNVTSNLTIYDNFSEQFLVNIVAQPTLYAPPSYLYYFCDAYEGFFWDFKTCSKTNYNLTPAPGPDWVSPGAAMNLSAQPAPLYCGSGSYCYSTTFLNLTFDSWAGTGNGSVNTNQNGTSMTVHGPINETATFNINGWCFYLYATPTLRCRTANGTLTFLENGLPAGVPWSVSIWSADGQNFTTNSTTSNELTVAGNATIGATYFQVWTVPDAATGDYWVGQASPVSPVELPAQSLILVTFSLVSTAGLEFPLQLNQTGLSNGTTWSSSVDGQMYGVRGPSATYTVGGGLHDVNASPVYFPNGTGYYVAGFDTLPLVQNGSWSNTTTVPLDPLSVHGATFVTVVYKPLYWLEMTSSAGGAVSPSSQWVETGAATVLTASPAAGYSFVGWTGSGAGSVSGSALSITVHPTAPVRELATFHKIPLPFWTVAVSEVGLPTGTAYTVGLGDRAYTGHGSFNVSGLSNGSYALTVPYVYLNSSNQTRFVPTVSGTSYTMGAGGTLQIAANGTVLVTFTTQYLVTVGATGNGSVTPAPGSYWVTSGTSFPIAATPTPHYRLLYWNGSGNGALNTPQLSIDPTVMSPLWETAQFVWAPTIPPATFQFTVAETGLPANLAWAFSVGVTGAAGTAGSLVAAGLNGSYVLTVAPVLVGTGTRYIANLTANASEMITSNRSITVSFIEQFAVQVSGGLGGTVSPSGLLWETKGSQVTLTATPGTGSLLRFWNGTGTGAINQTAGVVTLTVTGPVDERATFAPAYPVVKTGSTTAGVPIAFGLLAVLLVIGLVVGLLVGRRRPPSSGPTPAWSAESPGEPGMEEGSETADGPAHAEGPAE